MYQGWQKQNNGPTVQGTLEEKLSLILNQQKSITGCGRTDTGVHGANYYFHFDSDSELDQDHFIYKLNSILPKDIVIHSTIPVDDESHARYNASERRYFYSLHTVKNPYLLKHSFYYSYKKELDLDKIMRLGKFIKSQDSFQTLCKTDGGNKTFICHINELKWHQVKEYKWILEVSSDRFLRGMIRLMVGMFLNFERSKLTFEEIEKAFQNREKLPINWSVPPHGLFLQQIKYPFIPQDESDIDPFYGELDL